MNAPKNEINEKLININ